MEGLPKCLVGASFWASVELEELSLSVRSVCIVIIQSRNGKVISILPRCDVWHVVRLAFPVNSNKDEY